MSKQFSNKIKELREDLGMTQIEFSEKLNIAQAALSSYEKGTRNPTLDTLLLISKTYNVSLDWLCGLSDKKSLNTGIETYRELFKTFISILETRYVEVKGLVPVVDTIDADTSSVSITLHKDDNLQQFFSEWCHIFELHCNNTIDDELYHLWIEKELSKFDYPINGEPGWMNQ